MLCSARHLALHVQHESLGQLNAGAGSSGAGGVQGEVGEALVEAMRLKELSPLLFLDALVEVGPMQMLCCISAVIPRS